jgi:hypothetical protein
LKICQKLFAGEQAKLGHSIPHVEGQEHRTSFLPLFDSHILNFKVGRRMIRQASPGPYAVPPGRHDEQFRRSLALARFHLLSRMLQHPV